MIIFRVVEGGTEKSEEKKSEKRLGNVAFFSYIYYVND